MTWKAYRVVFKLKSPLHIGCGSVGNVQRTRAYVTGRVFWGALTMRLTRDATDEPATRSQQYDIYSKKVHNDLAFTYFYPAIQDNVNYQIQRPWEKESWFRRRFLSSYASTALVYPQQAADEGFLHEVEFVSPRTLDDDKQVFLVGYVFGKENCELKWKEACHRLQIGGERGYGWGDIRLEEISIVEDCDNKLQLFNGYSWKDRDGSIVIRVPEEGKLLAHTRATENVSVRGEIEPLTGREWRSNNKDRDGNSKNHYVGQHVEFSGLCWTPGSVVERSSVFKIGEFGIWYNESDG
ncbi:hypothetical protein POG22_17140 [Geitlerinema sp. CS-897]|nr:hypothetical protein [Geitlerinema sp. CS-897]